MLKQAAKKIMMVRPKHFGYDPESASSNAFQIAEGSDQIESIQHLATQEFDRAVENLQAAGVDVVVVEDTDLPVKPNAVFPNNWISFHENRVILYPMMAANRRAERREEVVALVSEEENQFAELLDLSHFEEEQKYLESTGSVIFDYPNGLAYACRSNRTHEEVLNKLCEILGYEPVLFDSFDKNGLEIYHTNVMMCLAAQYAVICMESIPKAQRTDVENALRRTGHEIVPISYDQMYAFAGNMIEVESSTGQSILVMSEAAMKSLTLDQKERLSDYSKLLTIAIPTIEKYGGGSIRCMICRVS